MTSWWERFPGRLEAELEDFKARGLDFELDEALFRDAGRVLLRGSIEHEGRAVELEVLYPDLFAYLRPEVYAPALDVDRHRNPQLGNLCLLDRSTRAWKPEETGAWLVAVRVPHLLSLFDQGPEAMAAAEVAQGEPVSAYFAMAGVSGSAIFIPAEALELDQASRVGSGRLCFSAEHPAQLVLRSLVCELTVRSHGRKVKVVARADGPLQRRFGGQQLQMRWVRLDEPPDGFDADAIFTAAEGVQPGFGRPRWQAVRDGEVAVTGIVFPEEVRQGEIEDTWVFGVRVRRVAGGQVNEGGYVIRGERLTNDDLGARIPKLAPLRSATVAQIGLGALGGPLALEFARNQVGELRLMEHDQVEVAQTVRWPFGIEAAGHLKLDTIAAFSERHYPYTRIVRFQHRLGQTALHRENRTENELDLLARFLDGSSLVVDASAEVGVQQLVSDFSRERGLTQLYLSATEGARGGHVALIVPAAGGCWHCWKQHLLDQTIPLPPFDEAGTVQPRGCASPTFTGASFDLLPVTAQAARIAAVALRGETEFKSTVWVCGLQADGAGAPSWTEHAIPNHPGCPYCSSEDT